MRISDWSSDVCSSDLGLARTSSPADERLPTIHPPSCSITRERHLPERQTFRTRTSGTSGFMCAPTAQREPHCAPRRPHKDHPLHSSKSSEEHTSELQSLMSTSYALYCLKNKTHT